MLPRASWNGGWPARQPRPHRAQRVVQRRRRAGDRGAPRRMLQHDQVAVPGVADDRSRLAADQRPAEVVPRRRAGRRRSRRSRRARRRRRGTGRARTAPSARNCAQPGAGGGAAEHADDRLAERRRVPMAPSVVRRTTPRPPRTADQRWPDRLVDDERHGRSVRVDQAQPTSRTTGCRGCSSSSRRPGRAPPSAGRSRRVPARSPPTGRRRRRRRSTPSAASSATRSSAYWPARAPDGPRRGPSAAPRATASATSCNSAEPVGHHGRAR